MPNKQHLLRQEQAPTSNDKTRTSNENKQKHHVRHSTSMRNVTSSDKNKTTKHYNNKVKTTRMKQPRQKHRQWRIQQQTNELQTQTKISRQNNITNAANKHKFIKQARGLPYTGGVKVYPCYHGVGIY
jgi:hypothetical protein